MEKKMMLELLRGESFLCSSMEARQAFREIADYVERSEEVVRCKDCRHSRPIDIRNREEKDAADGTCVCCSCEISEVPSVVWEDDFCSYGKVKT